MSAAGRKLHRSGISGGKRKGEAESDAGDVVTRALPKRLIRAPDSGMAMMAPDRNGEERQAENAGADSEPFLGQGNMRNPAPQHEAVHEEDERDGPARFMDRRR